MNTTLFFRAIVFRKHTAVSWGCERVGGFCAAAKRARLTFASTMMNGCLAMRSLFLTMPHLFPAPLLGCSMRHVHSHAVVFCYLKTCPSSAGGPVFLLLLTTFNNDCSFVHCTAPFEIEGKTPLGVTRCAPVFLPCPFSSRPCQRMFHTTIDLEPWFRLSPEAKKRGYGRLFRQVNIANLVV